MGDVWFSERTVTNFRFLWPCIVSKSWSEVENQQDATVRCLLSTLSQHVSGIIMPIFRRTKTVCYCTWCTALVNTRLGLLKMGIIMPETCWESVDNKYLTVASCWFSLSLHNLLTMHGHRNLNLKQKLPPQGDIYIWLNTETKQQCSKLLTKYDATLGQISTLTQQAVCKQVGKCDNIMAEVWFSERRVTKLPCVLR